MQRSNSCGLVWGHLWVRWLTASVHVRSRARSYGRARAGRSIRGHSGDSPQDGDERLCLGRVLVLTNERRIVRATGQPSVVRAPTGSIGDGQRKRAPSSVLLLVVVDGPVDAAHQPRHVC